MLKYLSISIVVVSMLSACATVPRGQLNEAIRIPPPNDLQLAEVKTDIPLYIGTIVRWGGQVLSSETIRTDQGQDLIRLEVLQRGLDTRARPIESSNSDGRFVAYIPQPISSDKPIGSLQNYFITVVGTLSNTEVMQLSETRSVVLPVLESQGYYVWHHNRHHHDVYVDLIWGSSLYWPYHYRHTHYPVGYHLHVHDLHYRH